MSEKIGSVGRNSFFFLCVCFYVDFYFYDYQIYLDLEHTSHKILLSLFGYP